MADIQVEAMNEVYELATQDSEKKLQKMQNEIETIKDDGESMGAIKALNYIGSQADMAKYATLFRIKKTKEYKKLGKTWQEFCDAAGEPRRTIEDKLKDIQSLVDNVAADFDSFTKIPFNKIRRLGKLVSANSAKIDNNDLIIDGKKIPLITDNQEEIATAIDTLIETHKEEKEDLQKSLEKQKKKLDDNVKEETKGLTDERDHAIAARDQYKEEVDRLKPFDIAEKDVSWSLEHLKSMVGKCAEFNVAVRKFTMDERLKEEMTLQAKIEEQIYFMYQMIKNLRMDWDNEYYPDIED